MSEQDNIFGYRKIKRNGELVFEKPGHEILYNLFVESLVEGQTVEFFAEAYKDDASNPQLALVHVCLKKLAGELGYTLQEMKSVIKESAGLRWTMTNGKTYEKSFADCSKEEITLVMEALNMAGEMVGMSFKFP